VQACANGPPATTSWLICWPGALTAWLPGVGGAEANRVYLGRPCFVMVGATAGLAAVMLPEMHHLIGDCPGLVVPALAREIPLGGILTLHGDEARGNCPAKSQVLKTS